MQAESSACAEFYPRTPQRCPGLNADDQSAGALAAMRIAALHAIFFSPQISCVNNFCQFILQQDEAGERRFDDMDKNRFAFLAVLARSNQSIAGATPCT